MKRMAVSLFLALCPLVVGAQELKPRHVEQMTADLAAPRSAILLHARDLDGSHWVTHAVTAAGEPMAMGITRIGNDGSVKTVLASDLLPAGAMAPGRAGQVYGVAAMTSPRHYAATVGWLGVDRATHNALVLYRLEDDGQISPLNYVVLSNGGAVAGGPHDTVVVVTRDPANQGRLAKATIFDSLGEVQSDVLPFEVADLRTSSSVLFQIRLQRTSEDEFALLDLGEQMIHEFQIRAAESLPSLSYAKPDAEMRTTRKVSCVRATATELWSQSIADPGAKGQVAGFLGYDVDPASRTVTVARQLLDDGPGSTVITRYRNGSRAVWLGPIWQAALADRATFTGVANGPSLFEQRVDF
jgi:hypothetical protein